MNFCITPTRWYRSQFIGRMSGQVVTIPRQVATLPSHVILWRKTSAA
jgi:hypothetical protein